MKTTFDNSFVHVSIDLETLATTPDAYILSIGAVMFKMPHLQDAPFLDTFYANCLCGSEYRIDYDTVMWWMRQGDEARNALTKNDEPKIRISDALIGLFECFMGYKNIVVWGNGATFDISILEKAYRTEGLDVPWKYCHVRDMRTIVDLALSIKGGEERIAGIHKHGTAHNALDDAAHQARIISAAYSVIKGN